MISTYTFFIRTLSPLLRLYIHWRVLRKKEDPKRYNERFGRPSRPRPEGQLLWIHAASVGESLSVLPLIRALTQEMHLNILVTTGTVTSATLMAKNLSDGCFHQYLPLDHPQWVTQFLAHWQPTVGIFVDSDLWPTLLQTCQQQQVPLILLNARFSPKSQARWKRMPRLTRTLLDCFDLILTQTEEVKQFVRQFHQHNVIMTGNIKFTVPPLPYDQTTYEKLKHDIGDRPLWVAASTHANEESLMASVHQQLRLSCPHLLTIIVPRHPHRGADITAELANFRVVRRTESAHIPKDCEIYLVDTLGELGLFYALSSIAFVGGSFVPVGGHNPIEPAKHGCAVLWGPHTFNFREVCDLLAPAAYPVKTIPALKTALESLLTNTEQREMLAKQGKAIVENQHRILDQILTLIRPYFDNAPSQQSRLLA